MDSQVLSTVISGFFSLTTGLVSIWLSNRMEKRTIKEHGLPTIRRHHSVARVFLIFIFGFMLGAATMVSRHYDKGHTHIGSLISLCLLIIVAIFLAINHRKKSYSFWPYQLEVISLWFAYGAGWSLVRGNIWSDMVVFVIGWWLGSAFIGGIITQWKKKAYMEKKESFESRTQQQSTPDSPPVPDEIIDSKEQPKQSSYSREKETPLDIIKMRYAKGEITKKEFDQLKEDLT